MKSRLQKQQRSLIKIILLGIANIVVIIFAFQNLSTTWINIIILIVPSFIALLALIGEEERTRLFKRLTPEERELRDRNQILDNFYTNWIKGVLHKNTQVGIFNLDYELRADAVEVLHKYDNNYQIPKNIREAFREMGKQLLILGKPGAGKSILMLQLAEILYEEAKQDEKNPIPLVFTLPSWVNKKADLRNWLADEMWRSYGIPRKNAQNRLDKNQFILLLDGLDEVAETFRDECVEVIKTYRNSTTKLVICSREEDYNILNNKLNVNGAIFVRDLTSTQIETYLDGNDNVGLRDLINREPLAREMAQEPFLLNIMKLTYESKPYEGSPHISLKLGDENLQLRRNKLMEEYIENTIKNEKLGDRGKLKSYLKWIASKMIKNNQSYFYIEDLQPYDLAEHIWIHYRWSVGLSFGLISILSFGLTGALSFGLIGALIGAPSLGLSFGLIGGVIIALNVALISGRTNIRIVDRVKWILTKNILIIGLICALVSGLIGGLGFGLIGGLVGTLIGALIGTLIFGLENLEITETRSSPNQGIQNSINNCLIGTLSFGLIGVLSFGLIGALSLGPMFGLSVGGETIIKHITLRIILWRAKVAPLNYAKFLIHCADLGLLRQVGGGFIFRHRYLQEYFAQEWDKAHPSA